MEEGYYWSCNSSRTFGVGKSTDDHLQVFLSETLPDHNFISGQFLSGITDPDGNESKTMTANRDLFEIAKLVRLDEELAYTVIVTPSRFLMAALRATPDAGAVVAAIDQYLRTYGHQGYSMVRPKPLLPIETSKVYSYSTKTLLVQQDFVEPTQVEDPSALFATLKAMVADSDYDPAHQGVRAAAIREEKFADVVSLLDEMQFWQFR